MTKFVTFKKAGISSNLKDSQKYFQIFGCVEENATENRRPTANGGGDPQPTVVESSNSGGWQLEIGDIN